MTTNELSISELIEMKEAISSIDKDSSNDDIVRLTIKNIDEEIYERSKGIYD